MCTHTQRKQIKTYITCFTSVRARRVPPQPENESMGWFTLPIVGACFLTLSKLGHRRENGGCLRTGGSCRVPEEGGNKTNHHTNQNAKCLLCLFSSPPLLPPSSSPHLYRLEFGICEPTCLRSLGIPSHHKQTSVYKFWH